MKFRELLWTNYGLLFLDKSQIAVQISRKLLLKPSLLFRLKGLSLRNSYIILDKLDYFPVSHNPNNLSVEEILASPETEESNALLNDPLESYNGINWGLKYLDSGPIDYWRYFRVSFSIDVVFQEDLVIDYNILSIRFKMDTSLKVNYKKKDCLLLLHILRHYTMDSPSINIDGLNFESHSDLYTYLVSRESIDIDCPFMHDCCISVFFDNVNITHFHH